MTTLSDKIKREFERLSVELSPENLACDGERSDAEIRRASASLMKEWRVLERRAGRPVSMREAEQLPKRKHRKRH